MIIIGGWLLGRGWQAGNQNVFRFHGAARNDELTKQQRSVVVVVEIGGKVHRHN